MTLKIEVHVILSFFVIIIPALVLEYLLMYWREKKYIEAENESVLNSVLSGFLFYIAGLILGKNDNFLFYSGIILVVYSLIVVYGIIKKDELFKIQGWILLGTCMLTDISLVKSNNLAFTIVAALIIVAFFIVEGMVINNSEPFKIITYIALLIWIVRIADQVYNMNRGSIDIRVVVIIVFGTLSLINMVMILTEFYNTKFEEELNGKPHNSIRMLLDSFNVIFMLFAAVGMAESRISYRIIYNIIIVILAFINLPIKDKGSPGRYIYTSIKFTVLIYYSLWIYKTPNSVISICMIAFAVVCIFLGFRNRLTGKELRIYGLVMTLIFVVQFMIIDISYNSSALKALSYLISGTLCFGISFIYNYFEKKGKKFENLENQEIPEIQETPENPENPENPVNPVNPVNPETIV